MAVARNTAIAESISALFIIWKSLAGRPVITDVTLEADGIREIIETESGIMLTDVEIFTDSPKDLAIGRVSKRRRKSLISFPP